MVVQVEPRRGAPALTPIAEPIVEAQTVVKSYDTGKVEVQALRGVSVSVQPGEMVAVMGPSGCGKTTLLNCLSGLDRIDSGEVLIEGTALSAMSDDERTDYRARHMGFVFQFYNLMPVLTAVENVELPLLVSRVPAGEARRRALACLEMVGLGERATHLPEELSGGQRQRVTIARALVNGPAIVWADEPTGDLDTEGDRQHHRQHDRQRADGNAEQLGHRRASYPIATSGASAATTTYASRPGGARKTVTNFSICSA